MCKTRWTVDDVPDGMGWTRLAHFTAYLGPGDALFDEVHPERAGWSHTDAVLADVFDAVESFAWQHASANSKSRVRRPKRYPRPWAPEDVRHYGKDPIPIAEFDEWWYGAEKEG